MHGPVSYVSLIPRRTQYWVLTKGSLYHKNSKHSELSLVKPKSLPYFWKKHCHYSSFSGTLAFNLYEWAPYKNHTLIRSSWSTWVGFLSICTVNEEGNCQTGSHQLSVFEGHMEQQVFKNYLTKVMASSGEGMLVFGTLLANDLTACRALQGNSIFQA